MPSPWNASTERRLLLCIIDPKATPKWQLIASGMGPHFSAEACRYFVTMPYQWTAERERQMLLLAISSANLRPSSDTWAAVAALLGENLSASAVSQKYYKLRNESVKLFDGQPGSATSTPTKRKASSIDGSDNPSPAKRIRKPAKQPKQENWDGERHSDSGDSPDPFKREQAAAVYYHSYPSSASSFVPEQAWPSVNVSFKTEEVQNSSYTHDLNGVA